MIFKMKIDKIIKIFVFDIIYLIIEDEILVDNF